MKTLHRYVSNLVKHPDDPKYHCVRTGNMHFRVRPHRHAAWPRLCLTSGGGVRVVVAGKGGATHRWLRGDESSGVRADDAWGRKRVGVQRGRVIPRYARRFL